MRILQQVIVVALAAAVPLGCGDPPSRPSHPAEARESPPELPSAEPWPAATGRVFERVSPHADGTIEHHGNLAERYVLGEDGRFGLQFNSARSGFFEYRGSFSAVGGTVAFDFDASNLAGEWRATGTLSGECMTVDYNIVMFLADFEDGRYCRPEAP